MITMRILIVQNVCESGAFVSGGGFDGENIGLKAKKKPHKRTPQKCPKGPPEEKLEESASHHINLLFITYSYFNIARQRSAGAYFRCFSWTERASGAKFFDF